LGRDFALRNSHTFFRRGARSFAPWVRSDFFGHRDARTPIERRNFTRQIRSAQSRSSLGSRSARLLSRKEPAGPPAVGVVRVERKPITESNEFIGRVQAIDRVDIVARVTGLSAKRSTSRMAARSRKARCSTARTRPFEATRAKEAVADQMDAQLVNASITLDARKNCSGPSRRQATVDSSLAPQTQL